MGKTTDRILLEKLHKAITNYFNAENGFRRAPSSSAWEAKKEADRVLTITTAEVTKHLKQK